MDANKVEWMLKQRANSNGDAMVVLSRYIKQLEKYRLNALKHAVFCRTMEPFFRINLTIEEFVLLKAIIYSHSGRLLSFLCIKRVDSYIVNIRVHQF